MNAGNMNQRTVKVFDPTADEETNQDKLAVRLASLDGKVIGLLDNTKDLVDTLLNEVEGLLRKDFPTAQFRHFRKDSASSGVAAAIDSQLAQCDAVVTAIGD